MDNNTNNPASCLSPAALAYLGDSVIELMVRERLVLTGISDAGKLNRAALDYVRATAQSAAADRIEKLLSEKETEVFKRGRNLHSPAPKSASVREYRRATALEVLFAALYLGGETNRLHELFDIAYGDISSESYK